MELNSSLESARRRAHEIESDLGSPEVIFDFQKQKNLQQEYAGLKESLELGAQFDELTSALNEAKRTVKDAADPELRQLAEAEIERIQKELDSLRPRLEAALVPPDPLDSKDIIVEIRAGTGGDEAAIFAAELFRMYARFAERHGWKTILVSSNRTDIDGFKEVIFEVSGRNVFRALKFESGVHRVQRIPETEKSGRVHTSTATVVVLPKADDVDVKLDPKDLKIETSTARGHGGQSVNTTYSAIRITHLPTGVMVSCQDERSQQQNRERALQILRSRLLALEVERRRAERSEARKGQIGSGERSEKIRTYNFPQDRLTDHRINQNFHNLPAIMDGALDDIIAALQSAS